jgi:hypothetical protein
MLKENTTAISSISFFKLPFKNGTLKLDLDTLNRATDYRIPKRPYLSVRIKAIAFAHEVWTFEVSMNKELERVYIKVTATELLVSCSVDTDESYLSRYAYCALFELMLYHNAYDFEKYYLPDLGTETMQRKFLKISKSKKGLEVSLKDNYKGLFKPGKNLPVFEKDTIEIARDYYLSPQKAIYNQHEVLGYSLPETFFTPWRKSNHYPFLIPYYGVLNKVKSQIKSFTKYVFNQNDLLSDVQTSEEEQLNEICFAMKAIAPIKVEEKDNDEKTNAEIQLLSSKNFAEILTLWNQAFPILQNREHNFYYYTYGLKNLTVKPRKKYITACTFNNKKPELCFIWEEKPDHYTLKLCFKVEGELYHFPRFLFPSFFLASTQNPKDYYLLNSIVDCNVLAFFYKTNFKIVVLKVHYEMYFKGFTDQLRKLYKFINR